jgi:hypothetical protein
MPGRAAAHYPRNDIRLRASSRRRASKFRLPSFMTLA